MAPYAEHGTAAHGTGHGGAGQGDALDIYIEQSDLLTSALADWDATRLDEQLQPDLLHPSPAPEELADALGDHRQELHSAKYVRKHAPTAPAPDRLSDKVPLLLRLQTALDRGRGFPWPESSPSSSRTVSDRYNRDAQ